MKYDLFFSTEAVEGDGWGTSSERLDEWRNERVVPQTGNNVFMKKGGWREVKSVGFSTTGVTGKKAGKRKNRRMVLISVSRN